MAQLGYILKIYLFIVCFYFSACEISYEDTKVPIENVIGEVGGGFKVIHTDLLCNEMKAQCCVTCVWSL